MRPTPPPEDYLNQSSKVKERAREAFFWMGTTTIVWQVISWVVTLITARVLNPKVYGMVALAESVTPCLALIAELHISAMLIQRDKIDSRAEGALSLFLFLLGASISAGLFALAPAIANFYNEPHLAYVLKAVSLVFVIRSLAVIPDACLRRELRFKPIAIMNVTVGVSRVFLQLGLALWGFDYWSLVLGLLYREVACASWIIIVRGLSRNWHWDGRTYREAMHFAIPATASAICWVIFSTADNIVVGKLFGAEMLGYYSMAFFLTDLPMSKLNQVLGPVLMPLYSRLAHSKTDIRMTFLKVVRVVLGTTSPILIGMGIVASEGIPVVLGEKWEPMTIPLQVMCVIGLIRSLTDNAAPLFLALGEPKRLLFLRALTVLVMPPAFYFLGTKYGINGVYGTWLGIYPLLLFVTIYQLKKLISISIREYLKNLLAPLSATLAMAIVVILAGTILSGSPITILVAKIALGGLVYLVVMRLFFPGFSREMVLLPRQLKSAPKS